MRWNELIDLAQEAWYQRDLNKAQMHLLKALEILQPFGNKDVRLIPNLELLTELLLKQEKIITVEPYLVRLLDAQISQPNVSKMAIAKTLQRLAEVSYYQLAYAKAIGFGERALAILIETLGRNRLEIVEASHKLAGYYRASGNSARAETYYKQSLAGLAQAGEQGYSFGATLLRSYASFLQSMHRGDEAEHLLMFAAPGPVVVR